MRRSYKTAGLMICLMICCLAEFSYAQQTLSGTIKNENGEGVAFATIKVLNSNNGAVADQKGEFVLDLPSGARRISVQALGFATLVLELDPNVSSLDIVLESRSATLDEVVVTASKREEAITEVNTSITSISSKQIEDTRTWDLDGLTALVPNYTHQKLGVSFQQIQSIRGIQVFSENPAVATYVDGVNNLDILANGFAFTDIERIEVLRGPQGTLFGRNAMGGVVNIITKKPTNETQAFVELGAGNLGLQRYAAGVKTPLIKDKLFFGINGLFQSQNGYWENDTTGTGALDGATLGEDVGGENNRYGNLYLRFLPSSTFDATLNLKVQRDWSDNSGFFVAQSSKEVAFSNPDKINLARIGDHERNVLNSSLVFNYYDENFTVTSISSYQSIGLAFDDIDFPGFYHSFFDSEIGEKLPPQEVWSQEFRITGNVDEQIQYTAGLYGFSQVGFEPSTNLAFELAPGSFAVFRNKSDNYGIAAFGEVSYDITHKLKATAGLRYDYEQRESTFNGFGDAVFADGVFVINAPDTTVSGDYDALSPKVALGYAINERANVYVSYTRGFRAGGINAQRFSAGSNIDQTFDPEFSDNFEIGYKAYFINNRLSVNASAFLINWKDLQFFNLVAPFTFARENVGDARSMGVELEVSAIPVKGLQLDMSLGVNDTEYRDFQLTRADFATGEEIITQISGNSLSNAPSHTLFVGAQHEISLDQGLQLVLRGEVRNVGSYYTDIQNNIEQTNYTLINSRVGVKYRNYSVFIWGQNLNDEVYLAFGNPDSSFSTTVRTAAPRTYGIKLTGKL